MSWLMPTMPAIRLCRSRSGTLVVSDQWTWPSAPKSDFSWLMIGAPPFRTPVPLKVVTFEYLALVAVGASGAGSALAGAPRAYW